MGYYNIHEYNDPSGSDYGSVGYSYSYSSSSSSVSEVSVLVPVLVGVGALLVLAVCVALCTACCACCRTKSRGRVLAPPPAADATVPHAPGPLSFHPYHAAPATQFSSATNAHPPPYAPPALHWEGAPPALHWEGAPPAAGTALCLSAPGVLSLNDTETYKLLE